MPHSSRSVFSADPVGIVMQATPRRAARCHTHRPREPRGLSNRAKCGITDLLTDKRPLWSSPTCSRPKIGYPDIWRDYQSSGSRGRCVWQRAAAAEFAWHHDADRIGEKTDRDEWGMTPPTVNAYYNPTFNEVVFPAPFCSRRSRS